MSMATALSNVFSLQRARFESERVANRSHDEEGDDDNSLTEEEIEPRAAADEEMGVTSVDPDGVYEVEPGEEGEALRDSHVEVPQGDSVGVTHLRRATVSLAELEEERELARRRSSACVLLAVFVLFRLWIEAITTGDFGLLLLCLVGTSWTARWIRHNHEREEELDRRIATYVEGSDSNTTTVERSDLRMLSFQAQLALAIMESQRQMMEGGYGNPDGANSTPGVSDAARGKWDRFEYKDPVDGEKNNTKGHYGSVAQSDLQNSKDDAPHCSICLGEYEADEKLVKVPCYHVYHEDCITSWTTNHQRCPLCNYDLESQSTDVVAQSLAI